MVMRRLSRFEDGPPQRQLAIFRRTPFQALGQGLFVGAIAGLLLVVVSAAAMAVRWLSGGHTPPTALEWAAYAFVWPLGVGAVVGMAFGARAGAVADDVGLKATPSTHRASAAWTEIVDIRAERRRSRTVVVVYPEDGPPMRLLAPYDGGALSHDAHFERKYFMLLNLWETHRSWKKRH